MNDSAASSAEPLQLGRRYLYGIGVNRDIKLAIAHLETAAARGCSDSMFLLSTLANEGTFVPFDPKGACEWANKAANAGNPLAMLFVANLFLDGSWDYKRDINSGIGWLEKATALGSPDAMYLLAQVLIHHGTDLDKTQRVAKLTLEAAESGLGEALVAFAYLLINEKAGQKKDGKKASDLLRRAAKLGPQDASRLLPQNGFTVLTTSSGSGTDAAMEYTSEEERSSALARFRLGDWGSTSRRVWEENDRALTTGGFVEARFPLDPNRTILVQCKVSEGHFHLSLEGEESSSVGQCG